MEIEIPGIPIAKKRPRFFRRGNFVGTYSDQKTEEGRWQLLAREQIQTMAEGPIVLTCAFAFPILKGATKTFRAMVEAGEIVPHVKRPDLDNLIKFVKDCLNGLAWADDSQVWKVTARKFYATHPYTWLRIM
jgi:Holliday junction resolvase RusA-like endonuclease